MERKSIEQGTSTSVTGESDVQQWYRQLTISHRPTTQMTIETQPEDTHVDNCLALGSIVSSNSHLDYTVEIYKETDRERAPQIDEREFGQPVFIQKSVNGEPYLVMGVIYNTQLVDPDQGRTGPRLAQSDQGQFTPGYIEERTTLAGVALLGTARVTEDGLLTDPSHELPRWTLEVDDIVCQCPDELTKTFHMNDEGGLQFAYADRILNVGGPLGSDVLLSIIGRLRSMIADTDKNQRVLDVVEQNITWQAHTDRGVIR